MKLKSIGFWGVRRKLSFSAIGFGLTSYTDAQLRCTDNTDEDCTPKPKGALRYPSGVVTQSSPSCRESLLCFFDQFGLLFPPIPGVVEACRWWSSKAGLLCQGLS